MNRNSHFNNEECIICLQEDLAVELNYCDEVLCGAILLFRVRRDHRILKGLKYVQHPKTNKTIFRIARCFVTSADREYSLQYLSRLTGQPGAQPLELSTK